MFHFIKTFILYRSTQNIKNQYRTEANQETIPCMVCLENYYETIVDVVLCCFMFSITKSKYFDLCEQKFRRVWEYNFGYKNQNSLWVIFIKVFNHIIKLFP